MFPAHSVMTKKVITVKRSTPIYEAIRLLVKYSIAGLPVVDDDMNLVGIVSEKDALKLLHAADASSATVSDLMTKDVVAFDENASLVEICNCLIKNHFRRVPITSHGKKLVGVISRRDIMKKILDMKHIGLEKQNLEGEDA